MNIYLVVIAIAHSLLLPIDCFHSTQVTMMNKQSNRSTAGGKTMPQYLAMLFNSVSAKSQKQALAATVFIGIGSSVEAISNQGAAIVQ